MIAIRSSTNRFRQRVPSRLGPPAPWMHRAGHFLTSSGLRGSNILWQGLDAVARRPTRVDWCIGATAVELKSPYHFAEKQLYEGRYELDELRLASALVQPGDLCIDVGANIGIWTLVLARLVGCAGLVHAFEPSPIARERLLRAVRDLSNVQVHPQALGAKLEKREMQVAQGDSMHTSLRVGGPRIPGTTPMVADVAPLTDFEISDEIAFLKVDVEGFESAVLEGVYPFFEKMKVCSSLWEVDPHYASTDWVSRILELPGYQSFVVGRRDRFSLIHKIALRAVQEKMCSGVPFSLLTKRVGPRKPTDSLSDLGPRFAD